MTEVKIGQMIVDDYGISKVIEIDDWGGYTSELIISKETFIEAYKKWIVNGSDTELDKIRTEKEKVMTYDELLDKFSDTFPFAKIDDYRPVCPELFQVGKVGITIWLENGDMIVYYPKAESEANNG